MTETSTLVTTTPRSSQRPQPAPEGQRWPTRRRWPERRADESGLTTLEWLLIVAAVAGLAALAVVLVTNVVSETGEQIAGSSARLTSAEVQAASVEESAKNANSTDSAYTSWAEWDNHFTRACTRISISYSVALKDANKEVVPAFAPPNAVTDTSAAITSATADADENLPSTAAPLAQAKCNIEDK